MTEVKYSLNNLYSLFYLLSLLIIGIAIICIWNDFDLYFFWGITLIPFFIFEVISNKLRSIRPYLILLIMAYLSFYGNYFYMAQFFEYTKDIYNKSAIYIFFCFVFLYLGSTIPVKYKKHETKLLFFKYYPSRLLILLSCIFVFFVTILVNLLGYKTTHSAELDQSILILDILLFLQNSLKNIIYFDFFFHLIQGKKEKYWKEEGFIIVFSVFLSLLSGSRGATILSLFVFPYLYVLLKKRVPTRFIAITMVFLILIVPFSVIYRSQSFFESNKNRDMNTKITAFIFSAKQVKYDAKTIGFVLAFVTGRFSRLEQSLRIVDWMPNKVPYKNGTTIFPHILISLVPTAIYPDRPLTNIGKWFGATFGFTDVKKPVFITAGIMNELYLNFGFIGFLGCFVFGLFINKFYHFWEINKKYLFVNLLYYDVLFNMCFFFNESYIVSGILGVFKSSVFTLFILIFFHLIDNKRKSLIW